jgi:hypothetical protein
MPTRARRSGGAGRPPRDAEPVPEVEPAEDVAQQRDTGSVRRQLSHGEQERLRRKLREKFH